MKNLFITVIFISAATMLVGCVEDNAHTNGYYSSGSDNVYTDDMTSGYNRDYQRPKNNGYQSSKRASGNGYASSSDADNNGYDSTHPAEQPATKTNGYRS